MDKLLTAAGQGYDGIGIAPISPTNAIEGVVAANAAGIPVVDLDEKIDADELAAAGGYIVGFATTDNVQVGGTGAAYIIETRTRSVPSSKEKLAMQVVKTANRVLKKPSWLLVMKSFLTAR